MEHFSIGIVSFVMPLIFAAAYIAGYQSRRLAAWSKREEGPKDRVSFFLATALIMGFGVGCFAQPLWDKGLECREQGRPLVACMIFPASLSQ